MRNAREPGPHPAVRALVGLALGLLVGALVALLVPRKDARSAPPPSPSP